MQFFTFYIFKTCLADFQTKEIKEKTPNPFPTNRTSYEKFKTLGKQKLAIERIFFFCKPNHTVSGIFCLFNFPTGSEVNSNKLSQFQTAIFFWYFFTSIYKTGPRYFSSPSAPKLKSNQYPVVWKYQCFFTRLCVFFRTLFCLSFTHFLIPSFKFHYIFQ